MIILEHNKSTIKCIFTLSVGAYALLPLLVWGETTSRGAFVIDPLQVTMSLVFVLIVFFLLALSFKRFSVRRWLNTKSNAQVKVISVVTIGKNEKLTLVEVSGERLLLGVSAGGVSVLQRQAVMVEESHIAVNTPKDKGELNKPEFSDIIKQIFNNAKPS